MNSDTVKAYFDGVLLAAYGVRFFGGMVAEWQLDSVKECATKFKEAEIDHSSLPYHEKGELKLQWKQLLEASCQGIKDELRRDGRLI